MRLSDIDENKLNDELVNFIVFSGIEESNDICEIGIVFGNYNLQKERILKATELYHQKRIKKMILLGGKGGISNEHSSDISEASLMKIIALQNRVDEADIIIEENSNNSIENCQNVITILQSLNINLDKIMLISSDFHLKRCYAIFKKYYGADAEYILIPVKNGFSDKENWFNSERIWNSGRSLVEFEAKALIKYAREGLIEDLELGSIETIKR